MFITVKKYSILVTSILLVTSTVFANDYDANYYEDEGALLFKIRGFYINSTAKLKNRNSKDSS